MATPTVQSVRRAFRLLQSFRGPTEWVACAELGRRAGLSEAGTHRMMQTLTDIGVVIRNARGRCRLNPDFRLFAEAESASRAPTLRLIANTGQAISKAG